MTDLLKFHHIGVACKNFERETKAYKLLGYEQESPDFKDEIQGIYGRFLFAAHQPRLELLTNTEDSHTLDLWLKNRTKMYHTGYTVKNFDKAIQEILSWGGGMAKEPCQSAYFKHRICFMILPNMSLMEIIEEDIK